MSLDLSDPATYEHGVPHAELDAARSANPVWWNDSTDGGFWVVAGHPELVEVSRDPALFSSERGGVVIEYLGEEQLEMVRMMLLAMDPPRHQTYRAPMVDRLKARSVATWEPTIRDLTRRLLDEATGAGSPDEPVEFVHDVAARLPSRVIGQLMGLPPDKAESVRELAETITRADAEGDAAFEASVELAMIGIDVATRRRAADHSRTGADADLTDLLLAASFDGEPMSDADFGSFFVQLVTAGNDTTTTALSVGVLTLDAHRDQLDRLRNDRSLVGRAVEEILRVANPLHYFRRTATAATELSGCRIKAGDRVMLHYTSANRDPRVFSDPHRFDIGRHPNPHLSFGIGEHFCLGAHLARLEISVVLDELLARGRFPSVAGEPQWTRSNLNAGLDALPVVL